MSLTIDNLFSEGSITGVTLNTQSATIGSFSATTISGGTYYGNGAGLIGVTGGTDTFTTGTTFTNNTLTIKKNNGSPDVTQLLNNFSGLTVNGVTTSNTVSATTISGGTFFGNGSGLTNVSSSVTYQNVVSSGGTSTSSTSYVDLLGMTITGLTSGNYLVNFGTSMSSGNNGSGSVTVINVDGNDILASEMTFIRGGGSASMTSYSNYLITVSSGSVKIRWRATSNTATSTNRYLTVIKV